MQKTENKFSLALVTGASSGIGEAVAFLLASKGISLIISGRDESRLSALAEKLRVSVDVSIVIAELANPQGRLKIVDAIRNKRPDLLINNAGFSLYGDALTYPSAKQMEILEVNGAAVLELSLAMARTLVTAGKKGVVVNISSAAAFNPFPSMAVYAASKAFVNTFSESFDEETRPLGIRVLASCPGMVETRFRERAGGNKPPTTLADAWMTSSAESAAREIWQQIERQQKVRIFDWKNRFLLWLTRLLIPRAWVGRYLQSGIKDRYPPRQIWADFN